MAKLTPSAASFLSCLGVLLSVGVVVGAASVASAQGGDPGVLYACVHKDRRDGQVHGNIRIVLPSERCRWDEARFGLNVGGPGGGDAEYGAIRGQVDSCQPVGGSFAYLTGHSFVVIVGDTGEFVMSHVPPGPYELTVHATGISELAIVSVEVEPGKTKDVGSIPICFGD